MSAVRWALVLGAFLGSMTTVMMLGVAQMWINEKRNRK